MGDLTPHTWLLCPTHNHRYTITVDPNTGEWVKTCPDCQEKPMGDSVIHAIATAAVRSRTHPSESAPKIAAAVLDALDKADWIIRHRSEWDRAEFARADERARILAAIEELPCRAGTMTLQGKTAVLNTIKNNHTDNNGINVRYEIDDD